MALYMTEPKKRIPFVAGLFNFLCPGLGFLYLGKPDWALGTIAIDVTILVVGAFSGLIHFPLGFLAVLLSLFGVLIASTVIAVLTARRQSPAALGKLQRWYVYVAYLLVVGVPYDAVTDHRAQLLGYETFRIPSGAMRETLVPGDHVMANSWKYRDSQPVRGDVVVFPFPKDPALMYLKRIVGLPGETILIRNNEVRVNGELLVEPYIVAANNREFLGDGQEFHVPPDNFFVLGDDRDHSSDSRNWGPVARQSIRGSIEFIWLSYNAKDGLRTERIGNWVK
jgi:signal peptidase I